MQAFWAIFAQNACKLLARTNQKHSSNGFCSAPLFCRWLWQFKSKAFWAIFAQNASLILNSQF
jgi:hypothetical protein